MKQSVFLFLISLGSLFSQVQDYFPLISGSTWVYRSTNGLRPLTIKVGTEYLIEGNRYLRVDGYSENPLMVRQTEQGNYVYWDAQQKEEAPFLNFRGGEFSSVVGQCRQKGRPEGRGAKYQGPVGSFEDARVIRYSSGICADAGLTSETFVPYVGLVQRAETSFTGERTLDLVYAQIGGVTYVSDGGVSFSIALTPLSQGVGARLVLHNRTSQPLALVFPSSQSYDFKIRNSSGEIVYTWSADKLFLQQVRQLSVTGEEVWNEVLPAANLAPGVYSVEGILTNSDGKKFTATSSLNWP